MSFVCSKCGEEIPAGTWLPGADKQALCPACSNPEPELDPDRAAAKKALLKYAPKKFLNRPQKIE